MNSTNLSTNNNLLTDHEFSQNNTSKNISISSFPSFSLTSSQNCPIMNKSSIPWFNNSEISTNLISNEQSKNIRKQLTNLLKEKYSINVFPYNFDQNQFDSLSQTQKSDIILSQLPTSFYGNEKTVNQKSMEKPIENSIETSIGQSLQSDKAEIQFEHNKTENSKINFTNSATEQFAQSANDLSDLPNSLSEIYKISNTNRAVNREKRKHSAMTNSSTNNNKINSGTNQISMSKQSQSSNFPLNQTSQKQSSQSFMAQLGWTSQISAKSPLVCGKTVQPFDYSNSHSLLEQYSHQQNPSNKSTFKLNDFDSAENQSKLLNRNKPQSKPKSMSRSITTYY